MTRLAERWAAVVTDHARVVIVVLGLATVLVGSGVLLVEEETSLGQFEGDSQAVETSEYIGENLVAEGAENQTVMQVIRRGNGEDVLTLAALRDSLSFQQALRDHPDVGPLLADREPTTGVANIVALWQLQALVADLDTEAVEAVDADGLDDLSESERETLTDLLGVSTLPSEDCLTALEGRPEDASVQQQPPPLSCQQWALAEMDQASFEAAVEATLGPDGRTDALALVPQSYRPGSTTAEAHAVFVTHETAGGAIEDPDGFDDEVLAAQTAVREVADRHEGEYVVFGLGLLDAEIQQSLEDSTVLVAPFALLFVALVLVVVYRDLADILLGVAGLVAVLLWTFGFMGWVGIPFNQMMLSVPVLLIGLSIDFALHAFMRHRERWTDPGGGRRAMRAALAGVVAAFAWVTATAAIGFLSNLVSPIQPLREFGVASALGIVSALLVFGALVPAAKVELDGWLAARGRDRRTRAFGTGGSRVTRVLRLGAVLARRAPVVLLVAVLVVSAAGAYGGKQIDTSFEETDFLAEDPPGWSQQLPGSLATGEYQVTGDLTFLQENFQQVGREGELLIRGNVTSESTFEWLGSGARNASDHDSTFVLPNGEPDVRSPLRELRVTAAFNPDSGLNESVQGLDGTTENVSGLYDEMVALNPFAGEVVHAENGSYEAIRMQVGIDGDATRDGAAADLERVATHLETVSEDELSVVATGEIIINREIERNLFETVVESLLLTLGVVVLVLAAGYRATGHRASLGVVTLLPVLLVVTWILGTMWLVGIPFNALTGTIAALTIGLGVDYSIHVSDRYQQELRRQGSVRGALETTVTGTGGALLGTAATTVGGFGTLALALLPALRQFGLVTGLTIVYAFLASVFVLPSLLVLWTRLVGPAGSADGSAAAQDD